MTIAMVNPPLANQLVPRVLDRASLLDVDSVAKSMVKGGALDLERAIVHPALSDLDANVIDELRDALLTGWKTKEDRVLANYLSDLNESPESPARCPSVHLARPPKHSLANLHSLEVQTTRRV